MATANNTIKTRISLKHDVEANWNKVNNFIPNNGEVIIYSAETAQDELPQGRTVRFSFSRLKIGDGQTTVTNLPFLDAGSLNGDEEIVCKYSNRNGFPQIGSTKCLYLDISTGQIYHYDITNEYQPIANVSLNATVDTIKTVSYWSPGSAAVANVNNHVLILTNGVAPLLRTQNTSVLTGVQIGEDEP